MIRLRERERKGKEGIRRHGSDGENGARRTTGDGVGEKTRHAVEDDGAAGVGVLASCVGAFARLEGAIMRALPGNNEGVADGAEDARLVLGPLLAVGACGAAWSAGMGGMRARAAIRSAGGRGSWGAAAKEAEGGDANAEQAAVRRGGGGVGAGTALRLGRARRSGAAVWRACGRPDRGVTKEAEAPAGCRSEARMCRRGFGDSGMSETKWDKKRGLK